VPVGPALIKEVERTNIVIVNPNQWAGFISRHDSYTIEIDCGRNYYSCGRFEYLAKNCKQENCGTRKKARIWR